MESDSIQDSTRYLVKENHYGDIMPGNRAEMLRSIYLRSGAHVIGGIYGNELSVEGTGITVDGTVYCKTHIRINVPEKSNNQIVTFQSAVVCPGTILIVSEDNKTRFLSDIYSGKINLKRCIVYGNVYASSAVIEDSVVLGGVYCSKQLTLKNSVVFTFRAGECNLAEHVSILSPFGFAEKIRMESTVNVLAFTGLFEKGYKQTNSGFKLDETDIYEIELEKKDPLAADKKMQVLSIAERLLNTTGMIKQLEQNRNFIEFLSLNSHLPLDERNNFLKRNKEELEDELWQIVEEKREFKEMDGSLSIKDMFKLYNTKNDDL
ncbi:MAG: hypothetical protein AB2L20_25885 [Mangrovibacterium sp.]